MRLREWLREVPGQQGHNLVSLALAGFGAWLWGKFGAIGFPGWGSSEFWPTAIGVVLLLVGAASLFMRKRHAGAAPPIVPAARQRAVLRLHVFGDHRTPQRVGHENIFRWFYLQTAFIATEPDGKRHPVATLATLFVAFEYAVPRSTVSVRSPDMQLPVYEVKEFNERFAVIVFSDNVPTGTLEIEVAP